jgi:hypothetical protein
MLCSTKELQNFSIGATDATIGKVKDFYVDDQAWTVRYLVVETGRWLSNRRVLIVPASLGELDLACGLGRLEGDGATQPGSHPKLARL